MKSVLAWTAAGVAVPAALIFGPMTIGLVVTGQLDDLPTALGYAPLVMLMIALPGAVAGLVVGIVDLVLKRYVANGSPVGSRRRPAVAALALFVLLTVLVNALLAITVTDMMNVAMNLAFSAVVAAVPGVVSYVRYVRIARTPSEARPSGALG